MGLGGMPGARLGGPLSGSWAPDESSLSQARSGATEAPAQTLSWLGRAGGAGWAAPGAQGRRGQS